MHTGYSTSNDSANYMLTSRLDTVDFEHSVASQLISIEPTNIRLYASMIISLIWIFSLSLLMNVSSYVIAQYFGISPGNIDRI